MRRTWLALLLALPLLLPAAGVRGDAQPLWPELRPWPAVQRSDQRPGDAALLVAVQDYAHLAPVEGALDNLADWEAFLHDGLGIPTEAIVVVTEGNATRSRIEERGIQAARKVAPGGTLWFVFIGHGATRTVLQPDRVDHSVLVGATAEKTAKGVVDPAHSIDRDVLLATLRRRLPGGARLVGVIDACFSGEDRDGQPLAEGAQLSSVRADTPALQDRETLLLATSKGQLAGRLPGARRPAFSYLLLAGLRGWGDDRGVSRTANGDDQVTPEEALAWSAAVLSTLEAGQAPRALGDPSAVILPASGEEAPDLLAIKEALRGGGGGGGGGSYDELREKAERATRLRAARHAARQEAARRRGAERDRLVSEAQERAAEECAEVRAIGELDAATGREAAQKWLADWAAAEVSLPRVVVPVEGFPGEEPVEIAAERTPVEPAELAEVGRIAQGRGGGASAGWRRSEVVEVPAGEFLYGCRSLSGRDETGCFDWELSPAVKRRTVAFSIDKVEVTVDRFLGCVAEGKCGEDSYRTGGTCNAAEGGQPARSGHPMNCVDWSGADAFCREVGGRLPTEEEWEKAARGTEGRVWPWGDSQATCSYAVMEDRSGDGCGTGTTAAVGSKPAGASPYGALDMTGNVWEWTSSCWESPDVAGTNDPGASDGCSRSIRGGSFDRHARFVRAGSRFDNDPAPLAPFLGFRCARSSGP